MRNKLKFVLLIVLIVMQIVVNRYISQIKLNIDFLFLILIYVSIKYNFYQTIISAAIIGWVTDYLSMNILGVFGFSRVFIGYLVFTFSKYLDIRRNFFIFMLVFLSMSISNIMANCFFFLIENVNFDIMFILVSPLLTALISVIILSFKSIKKNLNVY